MDSNTYTAYIYSDKYAATYIILQLVDNYVSSIYTKSYRIVNIMQQRSRPFILNASVRYYIGEFYLRFDCI